MKAKDRFDNAAAASQRPVPRVTVKIEAEHPDGQVAAERVEELYDIVYDECEQMDEALLEER